jgi:hypothetical protein
VHLCASDGERRLEAWATTAGEDLVVVVGGGARPHVGCVVLAQSRPSTSGSGRRSVTSSVLTIPPHKEEAIARSMAERVAVAVGGTVVVTAGVHDDGLDAAGVETYLALARRLTDRLVDTLTADPRS